MEAAAARKLQSVYRVAAAMKIAAGKREEAERQLMDAEVIL